jgi:branched-chain amino acid transport system substrate-binding protein
MSLLPRVPRFAASLCAAALLSWAAPALADIHVGVIVSTTGPAASLGIPEEQTIQMWPPEMAGQKVRFTILNDNSDTSTAAKSAARLISEDRVDVIIGASVTPTSLAVVETAGAAKVPVVSLAGGGAIVLPQDGPRRWAFKLTPSEQLQSNIVLDHIQKAGGKTVATINFANSYGEGFLKAFEPLAQARGVKIVASERYNPNDQSVTAQVLKVQAANPDAVYIFASGTPAALPQIELAKRGWKGPVYQTQGVANNDFLRVGGKDLEGSYLTVAPALVPEQLPESNPIRKVALDYVQRFEARHGAGSRSLFGASAWDALLIVEDAARVALKKAQPGTPEFRSALRDAIEATHEFVGAEGVYNMSPKDHNGVDQRAQVLVRVVDNHWHLQH